MEFVKLSAIGFVLGITAIIPGFSVATMAVVFNVYDRLINVIVPNVKKIFAAWLFWLPLVIGGIAGVFFFSKAFSYIMEGFDVPAYWFFIGVIAGSVPLIYSKTCLQVNTGSELSKSRKFAPPSLPSVICFILALAAMIIMAMIKPQEGIVVYTELSAHVFAMLTLAGALAAIAMIVPGISGAFMLLVIGFYRTVLQSVSDINIPLIIPVVLGAVAGLLISAAFVRFLLAKVPRETYGAVLGLVIGSIFILYPGFNWGEIAIINKWISVIVCIICLLFGFILSFIFSRRKIIG